MQPQIYIKGFSKITTTEELQQLFSKYEGIHNVRIIKDYAFIVCTL